MKGIVSLFLREEPGPGGSRVARWNCRIEMHTSMLLPVIMFSVRGESWGNRESAETRSGVRGRIALEAEGLQALGWLIWLPSRGSPFRILNINPAKLLERRQSFAAAASTLFAGRRLEIDGAMSGYASAGRAVSATTKCNPDRRSRVVIPTRE